MRKVKVPFQGRDVEGQSMDFETVSEKWNEYQLESGARVRLRIVPSEIIVTQETTDSGQPLVMVQSGVLVQYVPKDGE